MAKTASRTPVRHRRFPAVSRRLGLLRHRRMARSYQLVQHPDHRAPLQAPSTLSPADKHRPSRVQSLRSSLHTDTKTNTRRSHTPLPPRPTAPLERLLRPVAERTPLAVRPRDMNRPRVVLASRLRSNTNSNSNKPSMPPNRPWLLSSSKRRFTGVLALEHLSPHILHLHRLFSHNHRRSSNSHNSPILRTYHYPHSKLASGLRPGHGSDLGRVSRVRILLPSSMPSARMPILH